MSSHIRNWCRISSRVQSSNEWLDCAALLVSGLITGLVFETERGAPLLWFSLAPFARYAQRSPTATVTCAAYFGLVSFHLVGLHFMAKTGHPEFTVCWMLISHGLSIFCLFVLNATRSIVGRSGYAFALVPLAWVGKDSIVEYGAEYVIGSRFPFLQLGLTQIDMWFVQLSDIGGIPLITFLLLMSNVIVADIVQKVVRRNAVREFRTQLVSLVVIAIIPYGYRIHRIYFTNLNPGPTVVLTAAPIPVREIHQEARRIQSISLQKPITASGNIDGHQRPLVSIWPEASTGFAYFDKADDAQASPTIHRLKDFAVKLQTPIIVGGGRCSPATGERFNSVFFIDGNGEYLDYYDKQNIGPGDEFQPPLASLVEKLSGCKILDPAKFGWVGTSKGERQTPNVVLQAGSQKYVIAPSICFDIWFPDCFRRDGISSPDFFVNIADEVFSGDRTQFSYRGWALASARMRAIENRRSVVRCVGDGSTAVIDPLGRIVALQTGRSDRKKTIVCSVPICADRKSILFLPIGPVAAGFVLALLMVTIVRWSIERVRYWLFTSTASRFHESQLVRKKK